MVTYLHHLFMAICMLWATALQAQQNLCHTELLALKDLITQLPSFKTQVRGEKRAAFNALYRRIAADTAANSDGYSCFCRLVPLLFPLRDNHLGFYQLPDYAHFTTQESIDRYVASPAFGAYPAFSGNTDSLKAVLNTKAAEEIEGIYYYDTLYTAGIFKQREKEFIGVILDSKVPWWAKGQIVIRLYETAPQLYKAIYAHPVTKNLIFQPVEKFRNQSLLNASFYASFFSGVYTKQLHTTDHVNLPANTKRFVLQNLSREVQYVAIRSFQRNNATAQASQRFYDTLKWALTSPYVLLDLRNNEGGAHSEMKKFLSLFRQYVKKGQLYVLVNNGTLSQAEIFTLRLKRLPHVTIMGQQTMGMLAYGSNYGKKHKLPGGRFEFYPTDMHNGAALLPFEDFGITPDVMLQPDRNWIEQAMERMGIR